MRTNPISAVRLNHSIPKPIEREKDTGVPDEYWDWADNAESGLEHLFSPEVIAFDSISA